MNKIYIVPNLSMICEPWRDGWLEFGAREPYLSGRWVEVGGAKSAMCRALEYNYPEGYWFEE